MMKFLNFLDRNKNKNKFYVSTQSLLSESKLQLANLAYLTDQLGYDMTAAHRTEKYIRMNSTDFGISIETLIDQEGKPLHHFTKVLAKNQHDILFYQKKVSGFRLSLKFHFWNNHYFMGESVYEPQQRNQHFDLEKILRDKYLQDLGVNEAFSGKIIGDNDTCLFIASHMGFRLLYMANKKMVLEGIQQEQNIIVKEDQIKEENIEKKLFGQL